MAVATLAVLAAIPAPAQASELKAPSEFVALSDVTPTILHEIRYQRGAQLRRPQRAVDHFVRWAKDL
ncbi:hypothetical protein [Amycolatopsis decaplanina]|uniref:D-alanyl-D-alanine dipeptidase n=1 Tax=Amycolatopsis decaplanina DSM 44594 TaxID=1284240 RepID=M2ZHU7_9PSEU|nr:D-alanyl-D-alanine dipeptidase [Amycolatopsis decaplanina DSM 44594]